MTPRHKKSYRVLVVDDDPSVLATYRRLLCRQGYQTIAEDDPQRVLANGLDPNSIDLLLLDYKMPAMDGLSLLAELRRGECRARCILLSAFLNDDVRCQARNLGVDLVLEKPVGVRELRRALDQLLPIKVPVAGEPGPGEPRETADDNEQEERESGNSKPRVTVAS